MDKELQALESIKSMKQLSQASKVHFQTFLQNSYKHKMEFGGSEHKENTVITNTMTLSTRQASSLLNEIGLHVRLDQTLKENLSPPHHKANNV